VDEAEFARRIKVYLELDSPDVPNPTEVATRLATHLYCYVRPERTGPPAPSKTLFSLLPEGRVLLMFTASWDGSAPGYRTVVEKVAQKLRAVLIEVDVDDPVGSAIARLCEVTNTPSVVDARSSRPPIVGARTGDELTAALGVG
jgi:hypothetical protein